jgi:hypothetical protein
MEITEMISKRYTIRIGMPWKFDPEQREEFEADIQFALCCAADGIRETLEDTAQHLGSLSPVVVSINED